MGRTRRVSGWHLLVLMALVLVTVPAVPATADHSPPPGSPAAGTGSLQGTELDEFQAMQGIPCFAAVRHLYGLRGQGTYAGRSASDQEVIYRAQLAEGQAVHQGPLQVQIENTQPFYHGPNGTHGNDSSCSVATAGTPISATFKIFAAEQAEDTDGDLDVDLLSGAAWVYRLDESGAKVPCTGSGTFAREGGGEQNWHADWTLSEDCTVVGNEAGTPGEGIAPVATAHTHLGFHGPCGGGCVDNFDVDYNQHLPIPGLAVSVGGPAASPIGQPVTVTAGVVNDGLPVSGAAVTFSVAGPGPGAPAGGTGVTGADGRTGFTFTAAVEGDYTVTASATSATSATPLEPVSDTHTVRFNVPAPTMTLSGMTRAQTEDPVTVVATVIDENTAIDYDSNGDPKRAPVPGVTVDFTVTGAGEATPASGSATTNSDGRALFNFAGDRAGDYTVSASTTYLGESASATHTVSLDIKTLSRLGAIDLPAGELNLSSAVIDPAGDFAYYGTGTGAFPGRLVKVDLNTFQRVGAITLAQGEEVLRSAVIDPTGDFAYFSTGTSPTRVVKVDLATFERVGTITFAQGENSARSAVIDPSGRYAYFGTGTNPGRVVKVDLASFERVGAITLPDGEPILASAVIDPNGTFAYFGTISGRVVKVDLDSFQRVGAISSGEQLTSAVIDPTGTYAYFGNFGGAGGRVVKVDLASFERAGAVELPGNVFGLTSAVMDPGGKFAYFGAVVMDPNGTYLNSPSGRIDVKSFAGFAYALPKAHGVVKIDLTAFKLAHVLSLAEGEQNLTSAVIEPDGTHAYFGTSPNNGDLDPVDEVPSKVVKLSLTRPPNPALVAAPDGTYATDYLTPLEVPARGVLANDTDTRVGNGDALTAHLEREPAGGSVVLNRDGSFTYTPNEGFSGTDTFTYLASDGYDYSAPATVSIEVAPSPEGVRGSAFGYWADDISLFGGAQADTGPTPTVTLASDASNSPQSATATTGLVAYGPAKLFTSDDITLSTAGSMAGTNSATSSSDIKNINYASSQPAETGSEVFGYPPPQTDPQYINFNPNNLRTSVAGAATASETGETGSATITNGMVRTHAQSSTDCTAPIDVNVCGRSGEAHTHDLSNPEGVVTIPTNPPPNYKVAGHLHLGSTGTDHFVLVFNEHIVNPDGSLTVNPVHEYLGYRLDGSGNIVKDSASILLGHLYLGQVTAGVTLAPGANTAPTAADDAYTTKRGTALAVPVPGVLGNDTDADGHALSATSASDPANGSVVLNPDGSFTYTPAAGFTGTDTFTYTADDANGGTATATVSIAVEAAKARVADFDGDGDSDRSVFRKGAWYAEGQPPAFFGVSGDIPVPGDYNGDGTVDQAVYRKGAWYIQGQPTLYLGNATDIPVPGDYDGDGDTEAAVYRNGAWYVEGQPTVYMGNATDIPVPGDYNGDGKVDRAVYRKGAWYVEGQPTVFMGNATDIPVPGDYNADASTDRGIYRPSVGGWYVQGQPTVFLGVNGDVPVPGDYDANASTDRAIWRPSVGGWYVQGQPTTFLGVKGDVPLPLPQAIYRAFF